MLRVPPPAVAVIVVCEQIIKSAFLCPAYELRGLRASRARTSGGAGTKRLLQVDKVWAERRLATRVSAQQGGARVGVGQGLGSKKNEREERIR